jgi:flagellar biosynthesis component FlhA
MNAYRVLVGAADGFLGRDLMEYLATKHIIGMVIIFLVCVMVVLKLPELSGNLSFLLTLQVNASILIFKHTMATSFTKPYALTIYDYSVILSDAM